FPRYVATPLAGLLNVKEKIRLKATPNAVLEKFYAATTKHPKQADVEMLSKKSGCTVRQVERWFRRRRNQDRPSLLKKFREASWRFTFYLIAFIAGMAVIVDKPWFYDLREVWKGYPIQTAKMFNYAGWRNTCNNIFIVFAAVFIITRLVILPFCMMAVLQLLHIFWAYLIIRMAQKFITGKARGGGLGRARGGWRVVEDERSDREETDNSEEEEEAAKNGPLSNGHPVLNNNHRKND
ncbi:CERS2 synthase, partial [Alca torda]|nr:CERS2 synthase [Alca torda]